MGQTSAKSILKAVVQLTYLSQPEFSEFSHFYTVSVENLSANSVNLFVPVLECTDCAFINYSMCCFTKVKV